MAFRSRKYMQRNELVRYQLDDVIRAPGNNHHQKRMDINLQQTTGAHFMIGTMPILRCSFSSKKLLTERDIQRLIE